MIQNGDALDLLEDFPGEIDLIATDPPYAFGGSGDEHAISATVAIVLRESARKLKRGSWMIVFAASSWRSMSYMVEAVRGIVEPVRVATWCKPSSATKVRTPGWAWGSVSVIAFRKGKTREDLAEIGTSGLDHIEAPIIRNGRRAELPPEVASWAVKPFAVAGGVMLDPFAGSGALVLAAEAFGMRGFGFEKGDTTGMQNGLPPPGLCPPPPPPAPPTKKHPIQIVEVRLSEEDRRLLRGGDDPADDWKKEPRQ